MRIERCGQGRQWMQEPYVEAATLFRPKAQSASSHRSTSKMPGGRVRASPDTGWRTFVAHRIEKARL